MSRRRIQYTAAEGKMVTKDSLCHQKPGSLGTPATVTKWSSMSPYGGAFHAPYMRAAHAWTIMAKSA